MRLSLIRDRPGLSNIGPIPSCLVHCVNINVGIVHNHLIPATMKEAVTNFMATDFGVARIVKRKITVNRRPVKGQDAFGSN